VQLTKMGMSLCSGSDLSFQLPYSEK
jgi:hypothetical protein